MPSDPILPPHSDSEPPVPPQNVPPMPVVPGTVTPISAYGLAPNVAAGVAVLTGGLAGIVLLIVEKRDQFVRFWAMQSIYFGGAVLTLNIAVGILLGILKHILFLLVWIVGFFYWVVCLGILVLWILMIVQAFQGKEWELPILGKMARNQLAKMPLV